MLKAIDLRKGKTIMYEGNISVVHDVSHVVKGKGASFMQAKIKNIQNGTIYNVRYRVDDKIETPFIESKDYEYLYRDGDNYIVMDTENYEQLPIGADIVGEATQWLKPNEKVKCQLYEGKMITFEIPFTVELEVTETTPVVKGATATNQLKDAVVETGAKVRVPPFVEIGTRIRVDTRTGGYLERAK